jgi:hypothetical protein
MEIVCVAPLARWQSLQWQLYTPSGGAVIR